MGNLERWTTKQIISQNWTIYPSENYWCRQWLWYQRYFLTDGSYSSKQEDSQLLLNER
jgi:hypothetical protein